MAQGTSYVSIAYWSRKFNRVIVRSMREFPFASHWKCGCVSFPCSGYSYLICDHMRAVDLYISALENLCPLMAFPCASYKAFLAGHCLDCFNPFLLSCPRIGKCYLFVFFDNLGEVQVLLVVTALSPDQWSRNLPNCDKENLIDGVFSLC